MDLNTEYIWLGIGFALIIAEVTMGNFILFFLGLAAVITGLALWLFTSGKRVSLYPVCWACLGVACWRAFSPEAAFGRGLGAG